MGSGCSCHGSLDGTGHNTPEAGTSGTGVEMHQDEEEADSRPPTPFSRPITAVILQRLALFDKRPIDMMSFWIGYLYMIKGPFTPMPKEHCIQGQTFNTLFPLSDAFVYNEHFFFIWQMIELWHLLTNCLFHIKKQTFCIVIKST